MAQFPVPVADYLRALAIDHRAPAYLLSARDGRLAACGGELDRYDLAGLVIGEPLDDQVVYLMGLLPLEAGERQFIECLQIEGCPPTDIHLFAGEEGDWIVLLDASEREKEQRILQQKGNELAVNYYRLSREIQKKEVLLHCIVHDLAGPLMGIRGGFELLSMTESLSEEGRELIEIGLRQSKRQEKLIGEILQAFASEIEQFEAFSVDRASAPDALSVAREVAALLGPAYELNQVSLRLDPALDTAGDWKVVGERSRLERIFSNLVENALRHSPPHSTVTIGLQDEGEHVMATIDDEGPGVPAEVAGTLFQKFAQGSDGRKGKIGLGLYFCRMTVENWGGTIGQENRAEGGSRFWFKLHRPR